MRVICCVLSPLLLVILPAMAIDSPIVFFPGITNSALDAKNTQEGLCNTNGSYERLWYEVIRLVICGEEEMSVIYDPINNVFNDQSGVTIEVPGFGGTEDVEYIGLSQTHPYLNTFVDFFVDRGFVRGKSFRTAPYDWRLAADELNRRGYFKNVQSLIEETYQQNNNQKITLIAHSMGGLVSHHFLTRYSGINQLWKDKYVNAWVTLSGAWSGGVQSIAKIVYGSNFSNLLISYIVNGFLVPILRTIPGLYWLTPRASVYNDTVLISTPSKNYTAADYEELFNTIGYPIGLKIFEITTSVTPDFPAPNVSTYCYYGYNVSTPLTYEFKEDLNKFNAIGMQPTRIITGNGDGTVNQASSAVCHQWGTMEPKYPFKLRQYTQVNHTEMVTNERVLSDVALIVGASPPRGTVSRA